jgi:hypothetical protein
MSDLAFFAGTAAGGKATRKFARPPCPTMERVCDLKVAAPELQLTSIITIPLPLWALAGLSDDRSWAGPLMHFGRNRERQSC